MAEIRQNVLLLPPTRDLDLYDNPFTMDAQYAQGLTNFMPPTTKLGVRSAVIKLREVFGAVRGMYSYAVGAHKKYGRHWYDQTLTDGEYQALLMKFSENSRLTKVSAFNPLSNSLDQLASDFNNEYSHDYSVYRHTLLLCTGLPSTSMTIWSARGGWKKMK
jgi:hypothetical protein